MLTPAPLILLLLGAARPALAVQDPASGDNVILIVVDALRADHLSAYGYARRTSPNIDLLAKQGALFRRVTAPANWTLPSAASIMTSLYPPAHGATLMPDADDWPAQQEEGRLSLGPGQRLEPAAPTLARILSGRGYLTAGVVASAYVFPPFGIDSGFQEYRAQWESLRRLNDSVIFPWLAKNRRRRFFLYIHPIDVHEPYGVAAGDGSPYPKKWDAPYRGSMDGSTEGLRAINLEKAAPTNADLANIISLYDDGVSVLDEQVGRLMDELRRLKLLDRTLVILTSDHGDGFLEHGRVSHGNTPFEELLRVPLIIRFPDGGRPSVDRSASLVDILPTVLDFLGLPPPGRIQGRSLLSPTGQGERDADIAFSDDRTRLRVADPVSHAAVARSGDWKLIDFGNGRSKLYRLDADPEERQDLSASSPKIARRLRSRLELWRTQNAALRAAYRSVRSGRPGLDPDVEVKLRAAGYLK